MRLFIDTSVALAACGSATGASFALFQFAPSNHWQLYTTAYVVAEVERNLPKLKSSATDRWQGTLRPRLHVMPDVLTLDKIVVFDVAKDRPILFAASA